MRLFAVALALAIVVSAAPTRQNFTLSDGGLPTVDLGYELHQAIAFNESGGYYNFSNIRYAAPPTGNLRFRAPVSPAVNRSSVQLGDIQRTCPQANPFWELTAAQFIPQYLGLTAATTSTSSSSAASLEGEIAAAEQAGLAASLAQGDPEDCLFLDVMVPKKIFDCAGDSNGAPVLVWIYGGGFTAGSKTNSGDPAGLINRSDDGVIFVALNYRLGAFGWLSGPSLQADGTANVGLYDQRFALEWIKSHIGDFGGDPDRVTVIGESAGGASIMHQITAYGGEKGPVPFSQAITQSPGFIPQVSSAQQEAQFQAFLVTANVTSLDALRALPYEDLFGANFIQVGLSTYGLFTFGPTVDGIFVPDLPGLLLEQGKFDDSVNVMVGHNADEGLLFTDPTQSNDTTIEAGLKIALPTISNATLAYLINTLYPPIYDGSEGYTDIISRAATLQADLAFVCNTFYLDKAYDNQTHAYKFTIFPAIHDQDVSYTFYNDQGLQAPDLSEADFGIQSVQAALTLQDWIVSFAETGKPISPKGVPAFPTYGKEALSAVLGVNGTTIKKDDAASARCNWWQQAHYA